MLADSEALGRGDRRASADDPQRGIFGRDYRIAHDVLERSKAIEIPSIQDPSIASAPVVITVRSSSR
jgi:hypothetical protein